MAAWLHWYYGAEGLGGVVTDEPRVVNKKDWSGDGVYVGRPSKWGNPFAIGADGTRARVVEKYRLWIQERPDLLDDLHELRGKNLICWCAPFACHAEILMELANG